MVSSGPEPMTRSAKLTMIESAFETKFHQADFKSIERKGTGVVMAYNSKNHYCPTIIVSQRDYVAWQLECVGKMSSATITFINDVDQNNCTPQQKQLLTKLDSVLTQAVISFGGRTAPSTATGATVPTDVMCSQIPSSSGQSSSFGQSDSSSRPVKEKGRRNHYCHLCQYYTSRKEDLTNHLGYKHSIGKQYFCNVGTCKTASPKGKKMSSKKNLSQHIRTKHKGVYLHPCEVLDCDFKTDSEGILKTHMVKTHGDDKDQEYKCPKCNKEFDGQHLLSKHLKTSNCDLPKNFECDLCTPSKWFKVRANMVTHMKTYHTGEIKKVQCPQCQKVFGNQKSLEQHSIIHRGLAALARARAATQQLNKRASAKQVRPRRVGQKASKSAPAKLVPGASPRRGKGGSGKK